MSKAAHQTRFDRDRRHGVSLGPFEMAAQTTPMPTMIIDSVAPSTPIVFANDACLAMTGFARNCLLASPIKTLFGAEANAKSLVLLEKAIARGEAGMWQMNVQRANGSTFFSVVYLSPLVVGDDVVANHVINVFDLASLLCMARETVEVYPSMYDKAPGFIALSDGADHKFTYVNAAYKSFVKRDDLIGKTVAEALPEVVEQGIISLLDQVYQTGKPFRASDMPLRIWNHDRECAEERWVDAVYQPVRDESGVITGLFCSGHDVTELREVNSELTALRLEMAHVSRVNAMGTLAATLAHELNQPLTAISNYLAGVRPLGGQAPDAGRMTEALEGIRDASDRATGIIDHVRQMTRHRKPRRTPFNLKDAANEGIRLVRSSCESRITFKNRIAADLTMTADLVKIQQVLINLLQNACDATKDAPHAAVTVDAMREDEHLTVCVTDTGSGVAPEAVATMFAWNESFKIEGMGIGLSICRTIIDLHRGSIWLEKTGPHGSEFRFSIPEPAK